MTIYSFMLFQFVKPEDRAVINDHIQKFQADKACCGLLLSAAHTHLVLLTSGGSPVLPGPEEACAECSSSCSPAAVGHLPLAVYPAMLRSRGAEALASSDIVITAASAA